MIKQETFIVEVAERQRLNPNIHLLDWVVQYLKVHAKCTMARLKVSIDAIYI